MRLIERTFPARSVAALAVLVCWGVAGCAPSLYAMGEDAAGAPSAQLDEAGGAAGEGSAQPTRQAEPTTKRWVCSYDPTYNRDWHDDVLCTNGAKSVRPTLRPDDRFVTEDELMAAARKYERKLNKRH